MYRALRTFKAFCAFRDYFDFENFFLKYSTKPSILSFINTELFMLLMRFVLYELLVLLELF